MAFQSYNTPFMRSYIALLLLCFIQIFQAAAADHCCSIPRAELEARARNPTSPSCPSDEILMRLPQWCELCPEDFCRVGNTCMCPGRFLNDRDSQNQCTRSFLFSWPASVGEEDIFRRICRSDLETVATNNTSCCSLTQDELIEQRSTHVACPRIAPFPIKDKCHPCPPGTCRLGSECICPWDFSGRHAECENAFGVSWPDSVGRTDRDLQECEGPLNENPLPTLTPNFTLSSESCCSIPVPELNATLSSYSENCPSHALAIPLDNECGSCPPDTCRVNSVCVCPQYFERTGLLKRECLASFGAEWPESVGIVDRARRNCNLSNMSCCSLGEDALNAQIGLNEDCPSASGFLLADKCTSTCPAGTCRVGDECYCIEDFKERLRDQCEEDFGSPWPSSVGKEDKGLAGCEDKREPESSSTVPVSSSGTSVSPSVAASPEGDISSGTQSQSFFPESSSQSESRLSGVEIAGTVAGVVSAGLALVASVTGFVKWKNRQRARAAAEAAPAGPTEETFLGEGDPGMP